MGHSHDWHPTIHRIGGEDTEDGSAVDASNLVPVTPEPVSYSCTLCELAAELAEERAAHQETDERLEAERRHADELAEVGQSALQALYRDRVYGSTPALLWRTLERHRERRASEHRGKEAP